MIQHTPLEQAVLHYCTPPHDRSLSGGNLGHFPVSLASLGLSRAIWLGTNGRRTLLESDSWFVKRLADLPMMRCSQTEGAVHEASRHNANRSPRWMWSISLFFFFSLRDGLYKERLSLLQKHVEFRGFHQHSAYTSHTHQDTAALFVVAHTQVS